jgi:preprotein translocase subunit Sec61beta
LIRGRLLGQLIHMAKKKDGGIQQAAGLIRYFDEESEHAWRITPFQVYMACIVVSGYFYFLNHDVIAWFMNLF